MGPEAKIQKKVVDYAKLKYADTVIVRKNQAGKFGTNGYPDYEFNAIGGYTWFMEFKAPGKKPTALQENRIARLRKLGFNAEICDDVGEGMKTIDREMQTARGRAR